MSMAALLNGFGSMGFFASRAFLPAFLTALLMRFGPDLPWVGQLGILDGLRNAPSWFTHDITLAVLGLLALGEFLGTKNTDVRELMSHVDKYAKTIMSALTFFGVASVADVAFVDEQLQEASVFLVLPVLGVAGGVFVLATLRGRVLGLFSAADADDSSGVQGVLSWLEDAWASVGTFFLVLFPIVMLILIAIAVAVVVVLERRVRSREEISKLPCPECSTSMYPTAVACPKCKAPNASPRDVDWLGGSTDDPVPDEAAHPFRLIEKQRCSRCATRLEERSVEQTCSACDQRLFPDEGATARYLAHVDGAVPRVLLVSFALSLVPVVGLIPGVLYYRLKLVAPFRRYVPSLHAFLLRWLLRVAFFFLIALQWIPAVGGVVVPLMALASYGVYRNAFREALERGS
jgi:hypothetical protein